MKEIVKYHNDFNKIKLPSFTEQEQNLLFAIMTQMQQVETHEYGFIRVYAKDLLLTNKLANSRELLTDTIHSLKTKFFKADFRQIIETETEIIDRTFHLFQAMDIHYTRRNPDDGYDTSTLFLYVDLYINPFFKYLVDDLSCNFTRFELAEFIVLNGKYTKTLYRLLKQYRQTGYLKMEWQEFVRVMDIPVNYKMCDIDKDILKPALRELTKPRNLFDQERIPFKDLSYTKIKGRGRGRGGNVIGIEFSFVPQQREDDYIPTKDQTIANLRAENEELIRENFANNLAKSQNKELQERIAKLEKIAYGVGLYAYCGLKYYSEKYEMLRVLTLEDIPNSSTNEKYKAEILNEKTSKTFYIWLESPKHLMNIISKNEKDLFLHNQEIINQRFKK